MFKFLNIVMFVMFLISIAVQYNDPDGWIWMLIYLYPSVVTFMAIREKYTLLSVIGAAAFTAGFFYLVPNNLNNWIENEIAREAGGLLISAIWMIVLSAKLYRNSQDAKEPEKPTLIEIERD